MIAWLPLYTKQIIAHNEMYFCEKNNEKRDNFLCHLTCIFYACGIAFYYALD